MNRLSPPLVATIVLNFNGRGHLAYCLPSLRATDYANHRVLLVDNGSTDGSLADVAAEHSWVEVLRSERNLGWAGGNNLGIRRALDWGAEFILLANNDIRVHPHWVAAGVAAASSDPCVGIVGFDVFGAMAPGSLADFAAACARWTAPSWELASVVHGMAMLVRSELFRRLGLIDEAYFVYGEENDFELRAVAAGYRMLATNVPVWHHSQGTSARFPVRSSFFAMRNAIRLAIKNHGFGRMVRETLAVVHTACNPWFRGERDNVCIRRLRPGSVLHNGAILAAALAWNVVHLAATLRARRRDRALVQQARAALQSASCAASPEP